MAGDVVGPASSTDNAVVRFDGTTGKLIQNSGVIIDDSNNISGIQNLGNTGALSFTGSISPSQITGDQHNYNPTGLSTASALRLTTDLTRNITGLAGGAGGRYLHIFNVGSNAFVLKHESPSSSAANQFSLGADVVIGPRQSIGLCYDGTLSRWMCKSSQSPALGNTINVKTDFGAVGDNAADDTSAFEKAIALAAISNADIIVPPGTYKIMSQLVINTLGTKIYGAGMFNSTLRAGGNFSSVLAFGTDEEVTPDYVEVSDISIDTAGTTTKCVICDDHAVVTRFSWVEFRGDLNGDLLYSTGHNVDLDRCTFHALSYNTWGVNFDSNNQNCGVIDCRFGGSGSGIRVTNTLGAGARLEGLKITGTYFINTGPNNLKLGNMLLCLAANCVFDQATNVSIYIDSGMDMLHLVNNWIGLRLLLDGTPAITRSGSTATVTLTPGGEFEKHHLVTGQVVKVIGADQPEYNGLFGITVTGEHTFTYTVSGSPTTPATGTITVRRPGQCVLIAATAGNWHVIANNAIHCGHEGITIGATGSDRVTGVQILGNHFHEAFSASIALDSVEKCVVAGNVDYGAPPYGSWYTTNNFGAGDYRFDNNAWHTAPPALFHTGSTYYFGRDTGIVGRASGATAVGSSATSANINHGLFRTPTGVLTTLLSSAQLGATWVSGYTSTQFTVTWNVSGTPTVNWETWV